MPSEQEVRARRIFFIFIAEYFAVGIFFSFLSANSWPQLTRRNKSQVS